MAIPGYRDIILADSPIAYWRFGDGGTTAADSSGNGHTGTLHSVTTGAAGVISDPDASMSFDGGASNITTGYSPWGALSAITLEAWFNHEGQAWSAAQEEIFGGGNITSLFVINGSARLQLLIAGSGRVAIAGAASTSGAGHLVGTWDGSTLLCYLNGVAGAPIGPFAGTLGGPNLIIGSNSGSNLFYKGRLDELAIYNYALGAAQVLNHYNAGTVAMLAAVPATLRTRDGKLKLRTR